MGIGCQHMQQELVIHVKDRNIGQNEHIAHARVPMHVFQRGEHCEERIQLMYHGNPAGHLILKSQYHREEYVAVAPVQPVHVVVQQQPPMQPPMQQPQVVVVNQPGAVVWNSGFVKIHLKSAHLEHNTGGMFKGGKMDPYVEMQVGMERWCSNVCENGGKNPHWQFQHMNIPHHHMN